MWDFAIFVRVNTENKLATSQIIPQISLLAKKEIFS